MQRLRIDHLTEYRFNAPLTLLPHRVMLRPRENHNVRIASSKLEIVPVANIRWQRDTLDNSVALLSFAAKSDCLRIESSVVIEHFEDAPLDFVVDDYALLHPFAYLDSDAVALAPFCVLTWAHDRPVLENWLAALGFRCGPIETFVLLDRMNRAIHERFRYEAREEPGVQSPAETLGRAAGSCRDFAALFMEGCRQLGLASRFVSGYLHADLNPEAGGATHAWAEVYLPGPGWKGFDPTAGELAGTKHIAVAVAHHPEHVPPVAGSFLGSANDRPRMAVSVRVQSLPT